MAKDRVIKYRAWDTIAKRMKTTGMGISHGILTYDYDLEVMEFTGLHDKNGREVYEGDIVGWYGDTKDDKFDEPVTFGGAAFYPVCTMPGHEFEVIGNIYESEVGK